MKGWRRITAPTSPVVSVDEVRDTWLKLPHDTEDDDLEVMIEAATRYIENRGHMLKPQTWELTLDEFPCDSLTPLQVDRQPIETIDFIKYYDENGDLQTWDEDLYQVSLTTDPPRILPAYGETWPITRRKMEAVTVRLTGGYETSPPSIPAGLISAIKLIVGHLYANREAVIVLQGVVSLELPMGVEALIENELGRARVF